MPIDSAPVRLPLNDRPDYGLCFACGPRNKSGLQLVFERDEDGVATTFLVCEEHQGFPGYLHGGITSAILDEVMSRVSMLENLWTMSARLDVRFRHPIPIGQRIRAVAQKRRVVRGFLEAQGRIELTDGRIAAEATGTYAHLKNEALASISEGYPRLAKEWMVG